MRIHGSQPSSSPSPAFEALAIGQLIPACPILPHSSPGVFRLVGLRTRFGRYIYSIGAGEPVARIAGIAITRYKIYAFIFSGALAGLAGALAAARLNAAGPTLGSDLLLNTLGAIVIGGTSLSGGVGGRLLRQIDTKIHNALVGQLS